MKKLFLVPLASLALAGTMAFAESVPSGRERHCFLVVHPHAFEGLANVSA